MPAPYSHDLRVRVMDAVRLGMPYDEVIKRYQVSNSTILRWVRRLRETGRYAALPMGGKKPLALLDERDWIVRRLAAKPDLTLRALLSELRLRGLEVSYFAVWHMVRRAGLSFKKRPCMPASRTAPTSPGAVPDGTTIKVGSTAAA